MGAEMKYLTFLLFFSCGVDEINQDIQDRFDQAERKIDERLDEIDERVLDAIEEKGQILDGAKNCTQRRWAENGVIITETKCTVIYTSG